MMDKPTIVFDSHVKRQVQGMKKFSEPCNNCMFEIGGIIPSGAVCTFM
jgi:hypothetical protein